MPNVLRKPKRRTARHRSSSSPSPQIEFLPRVRLRTEATAKRLVEELRNNNSGVSQTAYHQAKQIEATPRGA
jgi:hypothetical protein